MVLWDQSLTIARHRPADAPAPGRYRIILDRTYAVESDFGPLIPKSGEIGFNIPQVWGIQGAFA